MQMRTPRWLILLVVTLGVGIACPKVSGQDSPEIEHFAAQASEKIAKERPKRVLLVMQGGCLLDTQLCKTSESNLRVALTNAIPDIEFVDREKVVQELKIRGYLSIDAYEETLVRDLASETGAEIIAIQNLLWQADAYELTSKIIKVSGNKEIGTFKVKIGRSAQGDDKPILVKDEESGVTLIVTRGNPSHSRPLYFPACMKCPGPEYPEIARQKRLQGVIAFAVTITVQGTAEQISLIKSFDASLIPNAIQTIRGWRFQPAIGPDGKPFAARVPLEVTYRLSP
jgi:TonB family protein